MIRKRRLFRASIVSGAVVFFGFIGAWFTPSANALGLKIYRVDNQGNPTTTIINLGNTGPTALCITHNDGEINLGIRLCYL